MRTITITTTHNIYKYHELSDYAKQNVKDEYLPVRNDDFSDYVKYDIKRLFDDADVKVQYSLNSCQGDGVNIYGSVSAEDIFSCLAKSDEYTLLAKYADVMTDAEKDTILYYAEYCNDIELPYNRRYCYCLADHINFADDWRDSLEWEDYENIQIETIRKFEELVQDIFHTLCKDYENGGYEYLYEISDEEMQELCEANEWEFYGDGTIY